MKQPHIVYVTENSMQQYQLDKECPICLTRLNYQNTHRSCIAIMLHDAATGNEPCATSCHHVMHYGCLRDWLIRNPICPVCRQAQSVNKCRVLRIRNDETVPRIGGGEGWKCECS